MTGGSGPVLAPSDLGNCTDANGSAVRVGGRIQWLRDRECSLADAFGQVRLLFETVPEGLSEGDLAQFAVRRGDRGWTIVDVEYRAEFPEPKSEDEWGRFVWSGKALNLKARDRVRTAVRHWFEHEGFLEVETPVMLPAPGLDSDVDPVAAEDNWLVTSPELCMKRLIVGGVPRIFQFARCFRRDELGPRHEPEFTMLEWYRAYSDLSRVLEDTEAVVVAAANALGTGSALQVQGRTVRLERPFLRLSVAEAFHRHANEPDVAELASRDRSAYFQTFVDRVEPALAEYDRPVFLYNYPASEAALARLCPDDLRWAERAELYLGGLELCNGYSELSSATEQRARFEAELDRRKAQGTPTYPLDERFLTALSRGMPPSAGNALGFDRLLMVLLGARSIQEVISFPRSEL